MEDKTIITTNETVDRDDKPSNFIATSTLTCPKCGFIKEETMPVNACMYFYQCTNCKVRLKPKPGDCCVFCSYGNIKCPPVQLNKNCCK